MQSSVFQWAPRGSRWQAALVVVTALWAATARAMSPADALAVARGESEQRIEALQRLVARPDARTFVFLQAMADEKLRIAADHVLIVEGGQATDAATGATLPLPSDGEEVMLNNRMRGEVEAALAGLKLFSRDRATRSEAINTLRNEPDSARLPMLVRAQAEEQDPALRAALGELVAALQLGSADPAQRLAAARALSGSRTVSAQTALNERLRIEVDPAIKSALRTSLRSVENHLRWGEVLGTLFSGISLGSILLLAALGLAITYGLMGVINMAHGELIMVGAYATYVVQAAFRRYWPGAFDAYLVVAVPVAFMAAAGVGAVLERTVIRFLYGRPLETLLATWGISLILMQAVRSVFGAQNVSVENPSWMSGSVAVLDNWQLPWNRLVIIGFSLVVLLFITVLIRRTRLGLFVRGVTQNRPMASCMGVNTARVDTQAFALGSGIAGLSGCALSQIGNVGPDLGQSYIVDSFMVVVLGGVGQLAGTVVAALGLGVLGKLLEGWQGAVLAKIAVLVLIIVFIQKRPQGLFAMKGRVA